MPNFSNCSETFIRAVRLNLSEVTQFRYNGPVVGPLSNIESSHRTMITLVGCRKICGTGSDYYEWKDSSATITTWVLPVIGLLLQAPYESNEFWRTLRALARWLGNPVASLSYTLWNIKVTSKCALMVDMATKYEHIPGLYDEVSPGQRSQFSQIRDSMYILSVMNQYEIKRRMPSIEAEKLLRVALFSDSLKLTADENTSGLIQKRYELATLIRKGRKKGVVPVFISLLWFIFSLGLSIQQAYGDLGANRTAHNMALGCLLSWLPVLILTGIVDRNPVAADSILLELNSFLDEVRSALLDVDLRAAYIQDTSKHQDDFAWTTALDSEDYFHQDFFTEFAGQGRLRWHYGVAQPIIASIEGSFMAAAGRNWLKDAELARTKMILGPEKKFGLRWFDFRMLWQIIGSICIMLGTAGGAFILSYFTPTVGLGCRSGGYLIFGVITFAISLVEFLVWCLVKDDTASPGWLRKHIQEYPLALLSSRIERHLSRSNSQNWAPYMLSKLGFRQFLRWYNSLSFKDRIAIFILDPSEAINAGWLVYIVIAQTFGWYQNCNCMASIWGSRGGYIDFASYEIYLANGVGVYWGFGIGTSIFVMCTAFAFIVAEYCTQSHLSTVDYEKSRQGLRWTRWFRKYTYLFRSIPHMCIGSGMNLWLRIMGKRASHERRSLSWTWKTKEQGLPALEDQGSNLQLSGGSRSRENDDASESDDSGEPGDILMGPLELAPVSVQEGRVGVGHYI